MSSIFIIVTVILLPIVILAGAITLWRKMRSRDNRRSPLTSKIYNLPGEQLRSRIANLNEDLVEQFSSFLVLAPTILLAVLLPKIDFTKIEIGFLEVFAIGVYLVIGIFYIYKITITISARRRAREGLAAEVITGQYLLPLLSKGCVVFHDIPAKNDVHINDAPFNLDHVVIGASAVFVIETKSRKKPIGGKNSAKVEYDGRVLKFSTHTESKPINQVKAQAKWLTEYLASNLGESICVVPVIALPGWYVENIASPAIFEVKVINPKSPNIFISDKFGPALTDIQKNRIANALAIRYPALDV